MKNFMLNFFTLEFLHKLHHKKNFTIKKSLTLKKMKSHHRKVKKKFHKIFL